MAKTIDLSTFAPNKVYELPIELPGNIRLLDNISSITVSFDSSRLETKTMNLPASCVQVVNLPSTYTLTVQTERLMNVTLCGPAGLLDTLVPEQVVIEIDRPGIPALQGRLLSGGGRCQRFRNGGALCGLPQALRGRRALAAAPCHVSQPRG